MICYVYHKFRHASGKEDIELVKFLDTREVKKISKRWEIKHKEMKPNGAEVYEVTTTYKDEEVDSMITMM